MANKLAKAIEEGFQLQETYRRLKARADEAEQDLKDHKKKLIDTFTKTELKEVVTRLGTAKLVPKDIPQMDKDSGGWPAIYTYVVEAPIAEWMENTKPKSLTSAGEAAKWVKALAKFVAEKGNWELLEKRLGRKACQERWKDKVRIPGVKAFHVTDLKFGESKEEED